VYTHQASGVQSQSFFVGSVMLSLSAEWKDTGTLDKP